MTKKGRKTSIKKVKISLMIRRSLRGRLVWSKPAINNGKHSDDSPIECNRARIKRTKAREQTPPIVAAMSRRR